jgi:hypothetical protein
MSENVSDSFNRLIWHDSKLRSLRILRNDDDLDEVLLNVELRSMAGQELSPMTVVLEDAVFFFSDIDLQGKRECSDDISSAKCEAKTDLMTKLQNERLQYSPDALAGYFHFSVYLIPPGGSVDVIASGFRLEGQTKDSHRRQQQVAE